MTPASRPTPTPRQRSRTRVLLLAAVVVAVLIAVGIGIAVAGDDDGEDVVVGEVAGEDAGGDADEEAAVFAPVSVTGSALPDFAGAADDPAVGMEAPTLEGFTLEGSELTVGAGEPTLLVFLAHWCPHCQVELPLLVDIAEGGGFDDVRVVTVLTGTNPQAPNFPPGEWVEEEGWTGETLVDDESSTAAAAYGLTSYPYIVAVDAEGEVVARTAGELPEAGILALVEAAQGA